MFVKFLKNRIVTKVVALVLCCALLFTTVCAPKRAEAIVGVDDAVVVAGAVALFAAWGINLCVNDNARQSAVDFANYIYGEMDKYARSIGTRLNNILAGIGNVFTLGSDACLRVGRSFAQFSSNFAKSVQSSRASSITSSLKTYPLPGDALRHVSVTDAKSGATLSVNDIANNEDEDFRFVFNQFNDLTSISFPWNNVDSSMFLYTSSNYPNPFTFSYYDTNGDVVTWTCPHLHEGDRVALVTSSDSTNPLYGEIRPFVFKSHSDGSFYLNSLEPDDMTVTPFVSVTTFPAATDINDDVILVTPAATTVAAGLGDAITVDDSRVANLIIEDALSNELAATDVTEAVITAPTGVPVPVAKFSDITFGHITPSYGPSYYVSYEALCELCTNIGNMYGLFNQYIGSDLGADAWSALKLIKGWVDTGDAGTLMGAISPYICEVRSGVYCICVDGSSGTWTYLDGKDRAVYALADTKNPAVSQPIYSVLTQLNNAASTINTNIGSIIHALNTAIGYLSQGTFGGNSGGSSGVSPYLRKIYNALYGGLDGTGADMVDIAISQMGVVEGQPYYTWYGFDTHVEWCACFVSWCAAQCGYLNTIIPKFAVVDDAVSWYQSRNLWLNRGATPSAGDIIFFDWDGDNDPDHVGIVASCSGGTVKTVEGNTGDSPGVVSSRSIAVNSSLIYGYGTPDYPAGGSSIYSVLVGISRKLNNLSISSDSYDYTALLSTISSKLDALVGGALGSVSGSASGSNIPDTYRQLLYLESTGTQYINSQLFYDGSNLQVDARLSYTSSSARQVLFGYWGNANSSLYAQYLYTAGGGPWNIRSGSRWVTTALDYPFSANKVYNFSMYVGNGRQFASVDGITACSASFDSGLSTAGQIPFYIFANNDADYNGLGSCFSSCRLYSLRVYMGGKLVRNYYPVSRVSDNALGLYDTVEGVFYGNSGSGSFIAGVPLTSWQDVQFDAINAKLTDIENALSKLGDDVVVSIDQMTNVDIDIENDARNVFYVEDDDGDKSIVDLSGESLKIFGKLMNFLYQAMFKDALDDSASGIDGLYGFYLDNSEGVDVWAS